jgi:hypothetical protein
MGQAKNRGTYEERVAQSKQRLEETSMPSFIKKLDITVKNNKAVITYDRSDLIDLQCKFIDGCITQLLLTEETVKRDPHKLAGYVFWGNSEDFSGTLFEVDDPSKFPAAFIETKDMFMSTYYATTNQRIQLSEAHCEAVIKGTSFQPLGAELDKAPKFTNFSVAVAYAWYQSSFTANSIGDLCPPEADPNSRLYTPRFIECVTEALLNMGVKVKLDWKPGAMLTEFVKEEA